MSTRYLKKKRSDRIRSIVFVGLMVIFASNKVLAAVSEFFAGTTNVPNATVRINEAVGKTNKDGSFGFHAKRADQYAISVSKPGYALVSIIEKWPNKNLVFTLKKAELISISIADHSKGITIKDSRNTNIQLPANAFGKLNEPINAYIYTYDLQNESMPGDMSAINSEGKDVYLVSAGVFWAEFVGSNSGKKYNLASGKKANISVPNSANKESEKPTLWHYDETTGKWIEDGVASLNSNGRLEGKVSHFSAWNFDMEFTQPACVKLELTKSLFDTYNIGTFPQTVEIKAVVTSPSGTINTYNQTWSTTNPPLLLSIYNIPANSTVHIYVKDPSTGNFVLHTTVNAGAAWGGTGIPPYPYDVCNGKITLIDSPTRPDIWIADPLPDNGIEPNIVSANIWNSPDIWVRNQQDGLTQHQNVKFSQDNYVYVRARNIGYATATNTTIEVYRTQASTSNIWPTGWLLVGSANIPTLTPSNSQIVSIPWASGDIPNPGHYCFYARAINVSDPFHIIEGPNAVTNTFNNNNIAWKNFNVIGLLPDQPVDADFIVRPILNIKPLKLVFDVTNEKGEVIKLADELTNVTIGGLENLPIKDPKGLEIIDRKEAKFTGDKGSFIIDIAKGEEVKLNLTFAPTALTQKDLSGKVYFHVKQFEGKELIGGVSYELRPPKDTILSVSLDTFTANAADDKITINWTTGTETDNAGFTLWRATPIDGQCSLNPSNYKDVRQVQPLVYSKAQDGVLGANYSEEDQDVEAGVTYCYGLEDVDYDGIRKFHVDKIISATLN